MTDRAEIAKIVDELLPTTNEINSVDKEYRDGHESGVRWCRFVILRALTEGKLFILKEKHEAEKEALEKQLKWYAEVHEPEAIKLATKSLEAKVGELEELLSMTGLCEKIQTLETMVAKMRELVELQDEHDSCSSEQSKCDFDHRIIVKKYGECIALTPASIKDELAEKDKRIYELEQQLGEHGAG